MESNTEPSSSVPKVVGGIVAVLLCCACLVIAAAGYILYLGYQPIPPIFPPTSNFSTPAPMPEVEHPELDSIPTETVEVLAKTLVPENDPYDIACRLQGICNVNRVLPSKAYKLGDQEIFWATNVVTVQHFQVSATLRYVTPHMYFWIENGVRYNEVDLQRLGDTFENRIYPINREFFGSESTPGIDNDPHIYILYVRNTGASNLGYYSSADQYNPRVKEYSNGHEMFVFNADNVDLSSENAYSVLAHEFQHMIHWNTDRNESTWVNEGLSMVAELINDYPVDSFVYHYIFNPDLNLTDWSSEPGTNLPHYGQSFLYLAYLLDRFGEDVMKAVIKHPANGLSSIDQTFVELNITDPQTGALVTADDIFMDWAATMYIMDETVGDGRYHYGNYPDAPKIFVSDFVSTCPSTQSGSVNQYGIDAITITCAGDYTINFHGSTTTKIFPIDPNSGNYAFWSNKGDESDITLTREFDFTGVSAPINLSYAIWYDLETDYDYVFLEASTDGQIWEILTTPSCTTENPSGNSYGCGYNGQTGNWLREDVDLSKFAGQNVLIRFEYITDAAVNGEGFLLDDVRVEAINYASDFEADDGGWVPAGFARVENILPQTFGLSLIVNGDTTTVTNIPLNADQTAEFPLSLKRGDEAILIVTGTTRFTHLPTNYQIEIK